MKESPKQKGRVSMSLKVITPTTSIEKITIRPKTAPARMVDVSNMMQVRQMLDNKAAACIQSWWKERRENTASARFRKFDRQVISLNMARNTPFDKLGAHLCNENTLFSTTRLLAYVQRRLTLMNPEELSLNARIFLTAFMIVGHPLEVFNHHTEKEKALENAANGMITAFYQVLLNSGKVEFLEFRQKYLAYLELNQQWKNADQIYMKQELIDAYVRIEEARMMASRGHTVFSEDFVRESERHQVGLLEKIRKFGGNASQELEQHLQEFQEGFQASKWKLLSKQDIAHEIGIHPDFRFHYNPDHQGIEKKLKICDEAMSKASPDFSKIILMIFEIRETLVALVPEKREFVDEVRKVLDSREIKIRFETDEDPRKYFKALFCFFVDKMIELRSEIVRPRLVPESVTEGMRFLLNTLDQLSVDQSNFVLESKRTELRRERILVEKTKFEDSLKGFAVSLVPIKEWLHSTFLSTKERARFSEPLHLVQAGAVRLIGTESAICPVTFHNDEESLEELRSGFFILVRKLCERAIQGTGIESVDEKSALFTLWHRRLSNCLTIFLYNGYFPAELMQQGLHVYERDIKSIAMELQNIVRFNFEVYDKWYRELTHELHISALIGYLSDKSKQIPETFDWLKGDTIEWMRLHNRTRKCNLVLSAFDYIERALVRKGFVLDESESKMYIEALHFHEMLQEGSANILPVLTKIKEVMRCAYEKRNIPIGNDEINLFSFLKGVLEHPKFQVAHSVMMQCMHHYALTQEHKAQEHAVLKILVHDIEDLAKTFDSLIQAL